MELAFTAGGKQPRQAPAAASSTRHTVRAQPEQPEHLLAVKVMLGHWQAMPGLVNMLVHKGKGEGERREEEGQEQEGESCAFNTSG